MPILPEILEILFRSFFHKEIFLNKRKVQDTLKQFKILNNLQVERPKSIIDFEEMKEMKRIKQEEDKLRKEQEKQRTEAYKQLTQSTLKNYRKETKPKDPSKFKIHEQKRYSRS